MYLEEHLETTPKAQALANLEAIRTLKSWQAKLAPTGEAREVLRRFNGWGALWQVFKEEEQEPWQRRAQAELLELLTPEEYERARASILNAHYTAPGVVRAIWDVVQGLGFTGGRVLEPSSGVGYFLSYDPMYARNQWTAVELEPISAAICQALHPEATVYGRGLETVSLPEGYFDLVIGNVPFGSYKPFDSAYAHLRLNIHNYFIARAVDLTRVGGLVVVITSTGTLDTPGNQAFRAWLAQRVNLIGALRLPDTTFKQNAGTEVTTDLLVLQRAEQPVADSCWLNLECSGLKDQAGKPLLLNAYYREHPAHLLGALTLSTLYRGWRLGLTSDLDVPRQIARTSWPPCFTPAHATEERGLPIPPDLQDLPDYCYAPWDWQLYQRRGGRLFQVTQDIPKIQAMLALHQLLTQVLQAQAQASDTELAGLQAALSQGYSHFIQQYGYLNAKTNQLLNQDLRFYALRALEVRKGKIWVKADIFHKRVVQAEQVIRVQTPADALLHCLNARGRVDMAFIGELLKRP
ncbi:Eco57I restriction-modification methylase domain-containing protein [Anthocerotibacter panamensis]|uniref:Eco57I restriction-modification methylase domain-containing protein n=1 Tax=Anthocerotibacter panamensis TaxID=2857077 RepID=UPI001C401660|nr:hypothetical protein [Anthocerotibacter panamensis]